MRKSAEVLGGEDGVTQSPHVEEGVEGVDMTCPTRILIGQLRVCFHFGGFCVQLNVCGREGSQGSEGVMVRRC
jgi:hypothetical protein